MNGFAGLNQFATDVDAAIAEADRIAASPLPATEQPSQGSSQPNISQEFGDTAVGRFAKTAGGWIAVIILISIVKFGIGAAVDASSSTDEEDYYNSEAYSDIPIDYAPDYGSDTNDIPIDETLENSDTYEDDYVISDEGSYPTIGEYPDDTTSRPAPGTMQLTKGELRYCMEEMERLKGEQSEMESIENIDIDRYNNNVDAFNGRLNDLRYICDGNYRIVDETAIEKELSFRRYSLQQEGRIRVR
ncbi:hypothetical protein [Qipengyuania sp. MTN3-11]|uniref:hypothetical protein n=1 Tax=Qipengyuania sp. MTN3-11 TaxID=3056557 RepID=UPI0036F262B3